MTTVTITGYQPDCVCAHCGRNLAHGIKMQDGFVVGSSCFANKIIAKNIRRFSRNGRPSPAWVVELAQWMEFKTESQRQRAGLYPVNFRFDA